MKPLLKARLGQLARVPVAGPARSGSAADLVLRIGGDRVRVRTIDAVHALVRCGVTSLKAKRAIESVVEHGEAVVHVPVIDSARLFVRELRAAGLSATRIRKPPQVDVRALRERLGCASVAAFAMRYNLPQRTVEGWEAGRPIDETANTYLYAIMKNPDILGRCLEEALD